MQRKTVSRLSLGAIVFLGLIRFLWTTLSGNCTFGIGSTVTICVVHGIVLLTMGMIAVIERKQRKEEG